MRMAGLCDSRAMAIAACVADMVTNTAVTTPPAREPVRSPRPERQRDRTREQPGEPDESDRRLASVAKGPDRQAHHRDPVDEEECRPSELQTTQVALAHHVTTASRRRRTTTGFQGMRHLAPEAGRDRPRRIRVGRDSC